MWALLFVLLIVLMFVCIASFELIVYNLFTHHPNDWVKAGKPISMGSHQ